ncbi:MAG: stage II sporulation protein R [Oscillospiraceae bacterium]|nr:stage II sporulation protein R [Oscillospiraceae bacterium]
MMKFRTWELSFIAAAVLALLVGSSVSREQAELSAKLVRLHVVASSDSEADQALKLRVRDAVLETLSAPLSDAGGAREAEYIINKELGAVEAAALSEIRGSGFDYGVTASVVEEDFPTREYDTFSLPAGRYTALRVTIGEGGGRNWWCVVFPPLCAGGFGSDALSDSALASLGEVERGSAALTDNICAPGLTGRDIKLITEEDGYVVRFKCMELLGALRALLGKA